MKNSTALKHGSFTEHRLKINTCMVMYGHDKNHYHFCKSDVSVVNLSEDLKNLVKVLKNMSLWKIR